MPSKLTWPERVSRPFEVTVWCTTKCAVPCQATLSPLHGLTTLPETGSSMLLVDNVAGAAHAATPPTASTIAAKNETTSRICLDLLALFCPCNAGGRAYVYMAGFCCPNAARTSSACSAGDGTG